MGILDTRWGNESRSVRKRAFWMFRDEQHSHEVGTKVRRGGAAEPLSASSNESQLPVAHNGVSTEAPSTLLLYHRHG